MSSESTTTEDLRMDIGALFGALWARLLRIILVTLFFIAVAYGVLMFVPKMYESSASLLVEDRSSSYTQSAGTASTGTSGGGITIDALMSSQIELIKSRDTLLTVIDTENLRSIPELNGTSANPIAAVMALIGRKPEPRSVDETVLANLVDRLTVIRERDSAVISIYVRSTDPQLSATIANAIAAEHVKRRAGQVMADTAEASSWLEQQISGLRTRVQEADQAVADYRAANGMFAGANGTTLPDQQISDIGRQITDAQGRRNAAEQRARLIRSLLASGQPLDGVEDVRSSAAIQSLLQSRATFQAELAEKLATLLPAHPTIRGLNAQITQVNAQITAEARRVADGLAAQVTLEDGVIASLNEDLARARLAASTQAQGSVTLDSLQREAKAQRDVLDSYLLRYRDASGRTEAGATLPDVRIITRAAPSVVPASPKVALTLGAVGFIALALQIGAVLFGELMSGRAVYDRASLRPVRNDDIDLAEPDTVDEMVDSPGPMLVDAPIDDDPVEIAARVAGDGPALDLSAIASDLTLGRVRIVLLAAMSEARDAAIGADTLAAEALRHGLSVCRVDAGSSRISSVPGLTDLSASRATFGDVVHKLRGGLAEVPWGQMPALDRRSDRPLTLVEALADVYEVVIVSTGRISVNSSLPMFAGLASRLVIVSREETPSAYVDAVANDARSLGFPEVESVVLAEPQSAVA